jgi:3-phenylpropionate/trans-cinnamate dioxygenase ferredoxin subunit
MTSHVVARAADIPPGTRKLVELGRREILVFNLGGMYFALANRCPHLGGSLNDGVQTAIVSSPEPGVYETSRRGEMIKCPWHGWAFDIRTGVSWCDPSTIKVRRYPASVQSGAAIAEMAPRAAETFKVRVEDDYVIVEV